MPGVVLAQALQQEAVQSPCSHRFSPVGGDNREVKKIILGSD